MECPKCKSFSVRMEAGAKVCGISQCLYVDLHPISFENDVMHYEGEDKKTQNRFTAMYSTNLDNGGVETNTEANFDKNFRKGKKQINDICYLLKLNKMIVDIAEARFLSILKIINREKKENQKDNDEPEEKEKGKKEKKEKHKNIMSINNMGGYSVYSACFEKENYFEDYNIAKILKLSFKQWGDLVREMNKSLRFKLDFIPELKPKHLIIRVCRKRQIAHDEEKAMIEMCERLINSGEFDVRNNTIAAIAFWKVCEHSTKYREKISLTDICKPHQKMVQDKLSTQEIQKFFDVTSENIKKVFKESVLKNMKKYLPNWPSKISQKETTSTKNQSESD